MPRYAEIDDLQRLALPSVALTGVSTSDINSALASASSQLDDVLRGAGELPLIAWGPSVRRHVAIIAAYDLMSARGYNPQAGADVNLRLRYQDTLAWMSGVARGDRLPEVTFSPSNSGDGDAPTATSSYRLRGW